MQTNLEIKQDQQINQCFFSHNKLSLMVANERANKPIFAESETLIRVFMISWCGVLLSLLSNDL